MAEMISFARGAPSLDIVDVEGLKAAAVRVRRRPRRDDRVRHRRSATCPLRQWIAERHGVERVAGARHQRLDAGRRVPLRRAGAARRRRRGGEADVRPHAARTSAAAAPRCTWSSWSPTGSTSPARRAAARRGVRPKLRAHHPQLPEPGRRDAVASRSAASCSTWPPSTASRSSRTTRTSTSASGASRCRRCCRSTGQAAERGGVRLVVHQDGLPGHPRRLPGRPGRRSSPTIARKRDEHLHLAEHGRPGDRVPVLRLRRHRPLDRDRQRPRSRRASQALAGAAPASTSRSALPAARRRLLPLGGAARGHRRGTARSSRPAERGVASSRAPTSCWRAASTRCGWPTRA